ncbi:MAG: formate dehydrogenase accessory sulfurtransferase FdhD [Candidatus Adiutrix sp.]|jgi:FdhD protein|nr:formate dehydrogenase accessory sulfurtransferase FdhD [Candidatus Adiutrix sp.]
MTLFSKHPIRRYTDGVWDWEEAPCADESRVDIHINGRRRSSVMATSRQLDYLALGFLFGEGLISGPDDVLKLRVDGLSVRVEIKGRAGPDPRLISLADPESVPPVTLRHPQVGAAEIIALMDEFNAQSRLFRQTGAVHSCCLIDGGRKYFADDVGRHNALDKVIGQYVAAGPSGRPGLILTTGRISTEILLKSARAGLGLLISRSAATDRAVELARRLNMIMIGFARDDRFNVYHGGPLLRDAPPHP